MTREELFRAVGEVREDQIAEAEHLHKRKHPWRRYGTLAACLAVVLAGAFGFNQWLHTGRDLPAMETAEDTADAGSGLDGSGNSGDAPAAPRYSVGVEIGEIDGSGWSWGDLFESGMAAEDSSLAWLDPEEILALDPVIFRGTVTGMRYYEVEPAGDYTVASVEVTDCLRGDLAVGDTYNVLYWGAPGRATTSISGDLEHLAVGSEAIFMPYRATEETGWRSGDTFFCYADLAELYFDEGIRFLLLDTGDGVSYAEEVYDIPAADGETVTLDDVAAYLRSLLDGEEPSAGTPEGNPSASGESGSADADSAGARTAPPETLAP